MNRWFFILLCILLMSGCGLSRDEASPTDVDLNEGMGDTAEDGYQSDEELLVESRTARININEHGGYSRFEAEKLVRDYLNITDDSTTVVLFDREENDQYIIHVTEILDQKNKSDHNEWYSVDPHTGKISEYKEK
ncbi:hypothetical protein [Bacillus sp. PS06]|uniref:hypothetical protein n=1 Tax=Bacillus sp. PS06 TaxID=2764176 RepID=UPI001782FF84|nr:hypothetical protein [Bacillus sp. PS06]MBD8068490.1 hypothetical protein [Bacillus sp. PS06]